MHEVTNARFGKEVADYLVDAFVKGVFAADSRELSMKAAFPPMWQRLAPKQVRIFWPRFITYCICRALKSNFSF